MQRSGILHDKIPLEASTIGIGTYLGEEDDRTDALYHDAITEAVKQGCNVIDTAINYREMRSERVVGRAVQRLMEKHPDIREKLIVATKGGFIPGDNESGEEPSEFFQNRLVKKGILNEDDVVQGCHSLKPEFIHECVLVSLENLGLEYIDIYYIHNPEIQLLELSANEFYHRLSKAFEVLENFVRDGRIRMYGTATWDGYRLDAYGPNRLSLKRVIQAAEAVTVGTQHHFRIIQLPINIYMPEAAVLENQELHGKWATILDVAKEMELFVMSSATLLQTHTLKESKLFSFQALDNLGSSAARRAIQIIRSLRGITTSLVGMKTVKHVQENLQLLKVPKLDPEEARRILGEFF
ncbi:MAG: aldo/keto reductase [Candidatus Brocadia sp.]|jgi:aryl-alcohol dehydrogenase-like predicted oxidoreductase